MLVPPIPMTRSNRLLIAAALLAGAMAAPAQETVWFLQMSDPQFGMYTENRDFAQETANFEFAIATANRLKPRFVVVCGDLVNKAGDADQIAEFHRIASKLASGIDLRLVAGNHDVGNTPTRASIDAYRRNFGSDYYTFTYSGFEGIVLDSSLIQHPEGAPEEAARQEKWLEAELATAKQAGVRQIVVFQHIPFFVKTADEADSYFNIPQATRGRYLELLKRSGVNYVFAGHLHHAESGTSGALHIFSAGPVGMPLEGGVSGMRVVEFHASGVKEKYIEFGHLPNRLEDAFAPKAEKK
jgi:3',5'-cyclic AMP phosphodiesterase CpdA